MIEALQFEFMQNALFAGIFTSFICGVIGTFVVANRLVFLAGGIAHAAYGGIGLALFLGIPYIIGTLGFSLGAALVMTAVTLTAAHRSDTFIGVLWAVGMAVGVILTDLTPGYNVDLMSYLFGSILAVPSADIWWMIVLGAAVLILTVYYYRDLVAISYDVEFARLRGVPVRVLYFLFMAMVAVSIVFIIRVVGLILVIAMLSIPPYIAEKYAGSLGIMMCIAVLLSMIFNIAGLGVSYMFDLTSGPCIILAAAAGFFISLAADFIVLKYRKRSVKEAAAK